MTDDLTRAEELAAELTDDDPAHIVRAADRVDVAALLRRLVARCREAEEVILRTGLVRGEDAAKIEHEIKHGTPNTPERIATIRRADEAYREISARSPKEAPDAT